MRRLSILYPHNARLMTRKAHDILVAKTCHCLAKQGHDVYLLIGNTHPSVKTILDFYGLDELPGLHIIQLPILRRLRFPRISWHLVYNISCLAAIWNMNRRMHFDVIYLTEIKLADFLLRFRRWLGGPFVYEVHGLNAKDYKIPDERERRVVSGSDIIVTTTGALRHKLSEIYTIDHASVVPLAASPISQGGRAAGSGTKKVFYVGRLYRLQGVRVLVSALSFLPSWVELHLIGGGREEIAELSAFAEELGLTDRIRFYGFLPHGSLAEVMREADTLVLPSLAQEKMLFVAHTKIYEYFAAAKPIVAVDLPSVREEIDDGINGILVAPENPRAMAEGILRVLSDSRLARELSENAFIKSGEYTWEKRATRLVDVFRAAASGSKS